MYDISHGRDSEKIGTPFAQERYRTSSPVRSEKLFGVHRRRSHAAPPADSHQRVGPRRGGAIRARLRKGQKKGASRFEKGDVLALDSGAVIALASSTRDGLALFKALVGSNLEVLVPAPVLAEVLRGRGGDAAVHRVLNSIAVPVPTSPKAARRAG